MSLHIGALSAVSGFSRDTIRYYERLGLIGKPARTDSGYRVFGEQSVKRLRVIRNARRFGFSLAEIGAFMRVRDAGGAPCAEVRRAAERRLDQVEAQLRELTKTRGAMRQTLRLWNDRLAAAPAGEPAHLLEDDVKLPEPRRRALGTGH